MYSEITVNFIFNEGKAKWFEARVRVKTSNYNCFSPIISLNNPKLRDKSGTSQNGKQCMSVPK